MTTAEITAAAQRAVFQSFHGEIDVALLDTLLVRVGAIPYGDDFEAYVAVIVEVVRATLRLHLDALTFACMTTPLTIH